MSDRVVSMPRAAVIDEGGTVEIELEKASGARETLQFAIEDFESFMGRAARLVLGVQSRRPTTPGHLAVHAVAAAAVGAEAPVGGDTVILTVRGKAARSVAPRPSRPRRKR